VDQKRFAETLGGWRAKRQHQLRDDWVRRLDCLPTGGRGARRSWDINGSGSTGDMRRPRSAAPRRRRLTPLRHHTALPPCPAPRFEAYLFTMAVCCASDAVLRLSAFCTRWLASPGGTSCNAGLSNVRRARDGRWHNASATAGILVWHRCSGQRASGAGAVGGSRFHSLSACAGISSDISPWSRRHKARWFVLFAAVFRTFDGWASRLAASRQTSRAGRTGHDDVQPALFSVLCPQHRISESIAWIPRRKCRTLRRTAVRAVWRACAAWHGASTGYPRSVSSGAAKVAKASAVCSPIGSSLPLCAQCRDRATATRCWRSGVARTGWLHQRHDVSLVSVLGGINGRRQRNTAIRLRRRAGSRWISYPCGSSRRRRAVRGGGAHARRHRGARSGASAYFHICAAIFFQAGHGGWRTLSNAYGEKWYIILLVCATGGQTALKKTGGWWRVLVCAGDLAEKRQSTGRRAVFWVVYRSAARFIGARAWKSSLAEERRCAVSRKAGAKRFLIAAA